MGAFTSAKTDVPHRLGLALEILQAINERRAAVAALEVWGGAATPLIPEEKEVAHLGVAVEEPSVVWNWWEVQEQI
ncbi:MAG TPA: hypothetical protein VM487_23715, partial [Phycisphaerae bacterium]|nr:hypothetical protein [Phycisphaerae bacterium]